MESQLYLHTMVLLIKIQTLIMILSNFGKVNL